MNVSLLSLTKIYRNVVGEDDIDLGVIFTFTFNNNGEDYQGVISIENKKLLLLKMFEDITKNDRLPVLLDLIVNKNNKTLLINPWLSTEKLNALKRLLGISEIIAQGEFSTVRFFEEMDSKAKFSKKDLKPILFRKMLDEDIIKHDESLEELNKTCLVACKRNPIGYKVSEFNNLKTRKLLGNRIAEICRANNFSTVWTFPEIGNAENERLILKKILDSNNY